MTKKVSIFLVTVALFAMASTRLSLVSAQGGDSTVASDVQHASDAAFRDGLFLGKLDASKRAAQHVSLGRWVTEHDRSSFRSGYEAGYRSVRQANR